MRIVSGSYDKTLIVWDAATLEPVRTLEGHGGGVYSVAWSPDGLRIASGSADGTIEIWPEPSLVLAMLEAQILRPSWVFTEQERIDYSIPDDLADWLATIPPLPTATPTATPSPALTPAPTSTPTRTAQIPATPTPPGNQ